MRRRDDGLYWFSGNRTNGVARQVQVSHILLGSYAYALMRDFATSRSLHRGRPRVALRQLLSASLPDFGILFGAYKPNRHQGKEADSWNLHLRSSTCYKPVGPSSRPRRFRTFLQIVTGWVLSHRHRYLTEVIFAGGNVGDGHWCRFHRFFSQAAWEIDVLGLRVRPVNDIFKAKEGFGKIDRGAVLTYLPSSSHTTTPSSDASQMPPDGARNGPGLVWEKTGSGLRDGQASAASPDRRIACHRSGSSSSIRRAGWVLIRSNTSRR